MKKTAHALVALVAVLHLWFLVMEMFLWTTPVAMKTFEMSAQLAHDSAVLAANQGLYNGILAAGLLLSFKLKPSTSLVFRYFLLSSIIVAGVYGAVTAKWSIILIQSLPAVLALGAVWRSREASTPG
jgi:putative membrane protein